MVMKYDGIEFNNVSDLLEYKKQQSKRETKTEFPKLEYSELKQKPSNKPSYIQEQSITRLENGLCLYCGNPRENKEKKYCNACRERQKAYMRKYYWKQKQNKPQTEPTDVKYGTLKQRKIRAKRIAQGLCQYCGNIRERQEVKFCNSCYQKSMENKRIWRDRHKRVNKILILESRKPKITTQELNKKIELSKKIREIWESVNGKIPQGYCVYHKDKDVNNNSIENLELITKSELFQRNVLNSGKKWIKPTGYRQQNKPRIYRQRTHRTFTAQEIATLKKYVHLIGERGITDILAKKLGRNKHSISNALHRIRTGELK